MVWIPLCSLWSYAASKLLTSIEKYYEENKKNNVPESKELLKTITNAAVKDTKATGSSTLVSLLLDKANKKVYSSLIGDSLFMIARFQNGSFAAISRCKEQTHGFNFPFQVGTHGDSPNSAIMEEHLIENKDVLVVGSDGLWDNLFDKDILDILNKNQTNGEITDLDLTARQMAKSAEQLSFQT